MLDFSGFRGWWPMRQVLKRDRNGTIIYQEVFRNMLNGEIHAPEEGWNGEPPYPTGELVRGGFFAGGSEELWESLRNRPQTTVLVSEKCGKKVYVFKNDVKGD